MTGNDLFAECSSIEQRVWCMRYVTGIADALGGKKENRINGFAACFPAEVTISQITDIAEQHLKKYAARRHLGAAGLVASALSEAFPCKQ